MARTDQEKKDARTLRNACKRLRNLTKDGTVSDTETEIPIGSLETFEPKAAEVLKRLGYLTGDLAIVDIEGLADQCDDPALPRPTVGEER